MHGVTKPVTLDDQLFKCAPDRPGGEVCGADAYRRRSIATTSALHFGKSFGFDMEVTLRISVEALRRVVTTDVLDFPENDNGRARAALGHFVCENPCGIALLLRSSS